MKRIIQNKYFIIGIFITLMIILSIFIGLNSNDNVIAESIIDEKESLEKIKKEDDEEFYIDLKGSVKNPGVYKVKKGMIVADAIKLAGGLNSKANTNNINLSKELVKEMVIYIYSKSEISKLTQKNEVPCKCEVIEVNNCIDVDDDNSYVEQKGKININTASKEELMSLKGIGEAKADAIIEYRSNNHFDSIEDIKNISGIGDAMFDKIKEDITV